VAGLLAIAAVAGIATSGARAAKPKPIVVGVSLSLSGDFSDGGKDAQRGYELWAADVNTRGGLLGRPVKMRILDDGSSPTQVVTNYQQLISNDHVNLVFGPYSTFLSRPASVVVARYGYAFFSGLAGGPALAASGLRNIINVALDGSREFDGFANAAPKLANPPKTAGYLVLDNPFTKPQADRLKSKLEAAGVKTVMYEVYNDGFKDFAALAAKLAAANPDVVMLGSTDAETTGFTRAFIQQKFNPKALLSAQGPDSSAFATAVGAENTEGVMAASPWAASTKTFGNAKFVKDYLKKYGGKTSDMGDFIALAYSVGQVAEQVVKAAGKLKQQSLIGVAQSRSWKAVTGGVLIGVSGFNISGRAVTLQWQGGKPVVVLPSELASAKLQYPKQRWPGQ
jgi:branched-chain amino acid transport system substrate-binding protein